MFACCRLNENQQFFFFFLFWFYHIAIILQLLNYYTNASIWSECSNLEMNSKCKWILDDRRPFRSITIAFFLGIKKKTELLNHKEYPDYKCSTENMSNLIWCWKFYANEKCFPANSNTINVLQNYVDDFVKMSNSSINFYVKKSVFASKSCDLSCVFIQYMQIWTQRISIYTLYDCSPLTD